MPIGNLMVSEIIITVRGSEYLALLGIDETTFMVKSWKFITPISQNFSEMEVQEGQGKLSYSEMC
jgi:hypothetical protein